MKPETVTTPSGFLFLMPDGFASLFIAVTAGTGNDDHQMEVVVQETGEPSQMSLRTSWNF